MGYFKLYQKSTVKEPGACSCANCRAIPELFHALPPIGARAFYDSKQEAEKAAQRLDEETVLIFWHSEFALPQDKYTNLNTGVTWAYDKKERKYNPQPQKISQ